MNPTDDQRATDLADALLGPVATDEIRALLRRAFEEVREEERSRTIQRIAESIILPDEPIARVRARIVGWDEQGSWS